MKGRSGTWVRNGRCIGYLVSEIICGEDVFLRNVGKSIYPPQKDHFSTVITCLTQRYCFFMHAD